ncbi:MAG TPA: sigma-70 family RNA polymerase sigma factor [Bryobacteraceae bacterium]|nr:sigma-70 family RNA polymerase sigma factor [Bryobacteraceae bacterium]
MPGDITALLAEVREGNSASASRLAELVYDQLHGIAARYMRYERPDHTLQATVLVDDAYLHMVNQEDRNWHNRSHFYAVAAQVMRRILIDHARTHNAAKRGGGVSPVDLDDALVLAHDRWEELIAVDEALTHLAERDPRLARIVEMRFFAGLTEDEVAEALGISSRTVKRDWQVAKAWLHGELSGNHDGGTVAKG